MTLQEMMEIQAMGKVLCLSEDEGTKFYKKRQSEYQFRRGIADADIKPVVTTPIEARKGETF